MTLSTRKVQPASVERSAPATRRPLAVVGGTALLEVRQALCQAVGARPGERVIDVGFGDHDAPPLPGGEFDVVLSTFGCMFAPDPERASAELLRLARPAGRIGLAHFAEEGFVGEVLRVLGAHAPSVAGLRAASRWGNEERLAERFAAAASCVEGRRTRCFFRARSAAHWLDAFRREHAAVDEAFAALDKPERDALTAELLALVHHFDEGTGALVVAAEYLELVIHVA